MRRLADPTADRQLIANASLRLLALALLVTGVTATIVSYLYFRLVFTPAEAPVLALACLAATATLVFVAAPSGYRQATLDGLRYSRVQLTFHGGRLAGTLAATAFWPTSAGLLIAGSLVALFASALEMIRIWGAFGAPFTRPSRVRAIGRSMIREGAPMLIWSVASSTLALSDRLIIGVMLSPADVGIYNVHYTLAAGIGMLLGTPLLLVVYPMVMKQWAEGSSNHARRLITRALLAIIPLGGAFALAAYLIGSWVEGLFGVEYVAPPLLGATLVTSATLWQAGLFLQKPAEAQAGTRMLARRMLGVAALNIALNVWLIGRAGIQGAALATLLSYALYVVDAGLGLVSWQNGPAGVLTLCRTNLVVRPCGRPRTGAVNHQTGPFPVEPWLGPTDHGGCAHAQQERERRWDRRSAFRHAFHRVGHNQ